MIVAGASFGASLTEKGSVIAWGEIRVCTLYLLYTYTDCFK